MFDYAVLNVYLHIPFSHCFKPFIRLTDFQLFQIKHFNCLKSFRNNKIMLKLKMPK